MKIGMFTAMQWSPEENPADVLASLKGQVRGAKDAGFGSLSRFNAVFRAACGCSPRRYRQRHRWP